MRKLNLKGLYCPEPLMLTQKEIRKMSIGEKIQIEATDTSTTRDFPKFCHFLNHKLISQNFENGVYIFVIEKGCEKSE